MTRSRSFTVAACCLLSACAAPPPPREEAPPPAAEPFGVRPDPPPHPAAAFRIDDEDAPRAVHPEDLLRQVAKLECLNRAAADGHRGRTAGSLTTTSKRSGMTNYHVIAKCAAGTLRAVDHRHNRVPARVLAADARLDIALVGFDEGLDVEPVTWGASDDLPLGSRVWVAGNANGQGLNLSAGVLSGRNRTIEGTISTDAAVNPGNSGGPLFDDALKLIGLITLKERAEGIAYAIPVEQVRKCAEDLSRTGHVEPAWFGVAMYTSRRRVLDNPVVIRSVDSGSPAGDAGMLPGDRVVSIAGAEVTDAEQARDLLKRVRVGDAVAWSIVHGDSPRVVEIRAGERPAAGGPGDPRLAPEGTLDVSE